MKEEQYSSGAETSEPEAVPSPLLELNLIASIGSAEAKERASSDQSETPAFVCTFRRKFYSSQALGGYQNVHKRERILVKRGNGECFKLPRSLVPLPDRPHGIQVPSVIHKLHGAHPNFFFQQHRRYRSTDGTAHPLCAPSGGQLSADSCPSDGKRAPYNRESG